MAERKVTVENLVENTQLEVVFGHDYLDRPITVPDIARPGLTLTGFMNYFEPLRVQLFGVNEIEYAKEMSHQQRVDVFEKMASKQTPAFVVSTNLDAPQELVDAAKNANIPILSSKLTSSRLLSNMTYYLGAELSKRETIHGVLVDFYGIGVLLTGEAGVGKSEAALELIQQGKARLVADDRVDVFAEDEQRLVGISSTVLQNLMEVRGVGIIDVLQVYGAAAIREHATIALNINLKQATKDDNFDRLGDAGQTLDILGINIPKMIIPITPGRNTASVIEAAALKYRAEKMGYDALATLEQRMAKQREGEQE